MTTCIDMRHCQLDFFPATNVVLIVEDDGSKATLHFHSPEAMIQFANTILQYAAQSTVDAEPLVGTEF